MKISDEGSLMCKDFMYMMNLGDELDSRNIV